MLSNKFIPSAIQAARFVACRRMMSSASKVQPASQANQGLDLDNFDPKHYIIPVRPLTMADTMEPYGSWKEAYAAEKKHANMILLRGIACFTAACLLVYHAGVFEGVIMPNLDNIMQDTEPFNFEKNEDRVSV